MSETARHFRPGCYAVVRHENRVLLARKTRGPFTGMFDLPGGGIEHAEENINAVMRELEEEIGLVVTARDLRIHGVFEHVVELDKNGDRVSQHLLGIVYELSVSEAVFNDLAAGRILGTEIGSDAGERIAIDFWNPDNVALTPICEKALGALRTLSGKEIED